MFSDPEVARTVILFVLVSIGATLVLAVGSYALAHGLLNAVHHFCEKHLFAAPGPHRSSSAERTTRPHRARS